MSDTLCFVQTNNRFRNDQFGLKFTSLHIHSKQYSLKLKRRGTINSMYDLLSFHSNVSLNPIKGSCCNPIKGSCCNPIKGSCCNPIKGSCCNPIRGSCCNRTKGSCCFLEQETLSPLFSSKTDLICLSMVYIANIACFTVEL